MKRILIIAGGDWQVPIIRKAKKMGLYVVNSNLYPESPGFEFSDICLVANVLDRERNLEYAKQYEVDAVITDQSDIAVSTVAYVAEKLGLPGIGTNSAEQFTNKYLMRRFCSEHGLPTPAYKLCKALQDAYEFVDINGLPVVVKPPANQSSRGVTKVTSRDLLAVAYEGASRQSHNGTVLIEGFVGGIELTVDGIKLNAGGHYCLATSSKTHYAHNEMVANRLWFEQSHPQIDFKILHDQHDRMVSSMMLPFGLTHAEYKYHEGKFYLIEVAARGGGTRISSDIVPLMSGINSDEVLIRMALGEQVKSIQPVFKERIVALDFFEFQPGRIAAIVGLERARVMDGVVDIGLNFNEGDIIQPAADDRSRHGYIIAFADDSEALSSLLDKVHQTVKVRYE